MASAFQTISMVHANRNQEGKHDERSHLLLRKAQLGRLRCERAEAGGYVAIHAGGREEGERWRNAEGRRGVRMKADAECWKLTRVFIRSSSDDRQGACVGDEIGD